VTAAVAIRLAHEGRLALDAPLAGQLAPELIDRWRALAALPRTTPRQLLAHTSGLPNYFTDQAFAARLPARQPEAAHHYTGQLDWTTVSPTIDWAGGGLVTTAPDLVRFVRALWSERVVGSRVLGEMTRWTPGASFPPGYALRYERYGLGMGSITVEGVELLGHTGFIGAFAFYAPLYDAVLAGTHNDSHVDRWPLVATLCRELRQAA
jgi:CubicO group peptidase (beta-lactamase class C family)